MPEEQGAPAPVAPVVTPAPTPAPQPKRFELPAESKPPEAKATPPADAPAQKEEAKAPSPEPEEKPEVETPEQAAKRQGRRFERRLDKAYRERAEAEARAKLAEEKLNSLQAPKPAEDTGVPRLDQFDYDPEKYAKATAEYEKGKALKEYEAKQRAEAVKASHDKLVSSWDEKVEAASEKYEDFNQVVGDLKPPNGLISAIMQADPAVAYHLGKNSKEAERVAALSPVAQILEIGRLEAKLTAAPEKPKTPSKAPEPIKPLSGTGGTQSDVPTEADDMKSWMRKRTKQVASRRN